MKKLLLPLLGLVMIFLIATPALTDDGAAIPAFKDGEYIPGELIVGMKDGVCISKEELTNQESLAQLFPGVDIVKVEDLSDVSDILPDDYEYIPYTGRQILLFKLSDKSTEHMIEAILILRKNPLVENVDLNGIDREDIEEPDDIPEMKDGEYAPGELILGMKAGVELSIEELTDTEIMEQLFFGVRIVKAEIIMNSTPQILWFKLAYDSKEYMGYAIQMLRGNPLVAYVELNGIDKEDDPDEPGNNVILCGNVLYQTSPVQAIVKLYNNESSLLGFATTAEDGSYTFSAPVSAAPVEISYTIIITKPGYLSYTIKNLTLTDLENIETVDMRQLAGDIDGNGVINATDLTYLLSEFNHAALNYPNADIDGNGIVNATDLTYLLAGFNKHDIEIEM